MVNTFGGEWQDQLELLRKVGDSTPLKHEWTIAESDGQRCMRTTARAAIDAAMTPTTGSTIKLVKVIAHTEDRVLQLPHEPDLPMRETKIDRYGRPVERWNTRPTFAERVELQEAQRDHRLEVEAAIDAELRALRHQKPAAAGLH